jgi:DNA polymerase III subunit epsilon
MKILNLFKKQRIKEVDDFIVDVIEGEIKDMGIIEETLRNFQKKYSKYNIDDELSKKFESKIIQLRKNSKSINDIELSNKIKGKSLLSLIDDYTVIDIETTGLSTKFDKIIELSAIKVRNGKIISEYSKLVNPMLKIDRFIEELTGITNKMLSKEKSIEYVIDSFIEFIGTDVILGHNINFDIQFINQALEELSLNPLCNDYVDTLRLSRKVYKEFPNHKLSTLVELHGLTRDKHRALVDCMLTHQIYERIVQKIKKEGIKLSSKKSSQYQMYDLSELKPSDNPIHNDHYFANKSVCFSGDLVQFQRVEAAQLVVNLGGKVLNGVNKNLNILVLGNDKCDMSDENELSTKHKKALQLKNQGVDIDIIGESKFIEYINGYKNIEN